MLNTAIACGKTRFWHVLESYSRAAGSYFGASSPPRISIFSHPGSRFLSFPRPGRVYQPPTHPTARNPQRYTRVDIYIYIQVSAKALHAQDDGNTRERHCKVAQLSCKGTANVVQRLCEA